MSRALQLNNTWGPGTQGPRACTSSSFPETRVWYWVTFEGPPRETIHQILYRAIRVYHRLRVHFYPRSGIFLRSPLLYVERGRLRGYIDRKPRCSMHAYGNRGRGGGVLLYLTLRMQIPRVQGDMISSASPQASRSSIVIRVSDQPFKDKEPGKM